MNYEKRNTLILSNFDRHAKHPATAALKKAAEQCLVIAQNCVNQCDELRRDSRYTGAGKRAKLEEVRAQAESQMQLARAPINGAAKAVERLRGQLKPAPVDHLPSSGVPAADYLKALAARDEQLNGASLRELKALEPVTDQANCAADIAHNDLASLSL